MAEFIGTVRQVAGDVFAVTGDGTRRVLIEGDRLFAGEQLQTGASGAVSVNLGTGGELTLGRGSSLQLTPQLLNHQAGHVETADELTSAFTQPSPTVLPEQVISADGQLQAPETPATEAPVPDASSLGGGHSAMLLTEVGGEVTPEIGFVTQGMSAAPEFPEGRVEGGVHSLDASSSVYVPPVVVAPPVNPEPPVEPQPPVDPEPPIDPPVEPAECPTAVADNVITNILAPCIDIPGALLLANDVPGSGGPLTASPTVFHTGWQVKGEGFSNDCAKTIDFSGKRDSPANQLKNLERSDFANTGAMTALVVVTGFLGAFSGPGANAQDLYSVNLMAGESVTVDLKSLGDQVGVLWQLDGGEFQLLEAGGTFTATESGVYRLLVVNQPDAGQPGPAVHYTLDLAIDYSAANTTPNHQDTYTVNDGHGGSDSAGVSISYQDGCTLLGTTGDDVLLGGAQDDSLHGGDGNDVLSGGAGDNDLYGDNGDDILFSGSGNEVLDGGAGNNTASYALAESGVTVSTAEFGPQYTGGAGTDTLINIQNLIGSNYDDHLTGDYEANVINGGLGNDVLVGGLGNDTLTGGAGHDTFKWLAGESGHDLVTDFSLGADTLDLSKLLQGFGAGTDSLDDFLHFKVTGSGSDLVSSIEIGSGGSSQTIDLAGINLAQHYGVGVGAGGIVAGADAGSIISGMLGDHSLRADVV